MQTIDEILEEIEKHSLSEVTVIVIKARAIKENKEELESRRIKK